MAVETKINCFNKGRTIINNRLEGHIIFSMQDFFKSNPP